MDNLQNLIPVNLQEATIKLFWEQSQGKQISQDQIILQAVLENVRLMLADELEGPYWEANWAKEDLLIKILDINHHIVGQIKPLTTSFTADFKQNAPNLIDELDRQIKNIVRQN